MPVLGGVTGAITHCGYKRKMVHTLLGNVKAEHNLCTHKSTPRFLPKRNVCNHKDVDLNVTATLFITVKN